MKQNYFVYNGKQYNAGTIVILQRFDCISRSVCNTKVTFLSYDAETKEYIVEIYGKTDTYTEEHFHKYFVEIYDPQSKMCNSNLVVKKKHTFSDELAIEGLLIAWIWYVFIMAIASIFYDRIGIWALASFVFFSYRNRKLKEAGYK